MDGSFSSSDAKLRLKWTAQLHELFVDAITRLGGADRATPKSVMRLMNVHGLTLYHLKSHLQKYRVAMAQEQSSIIADDRNLDANIDTACSQPSSHENMILKMRMEVQRRLHEQIEVQKHLQLRIEAQGKYLQSVLKKAQDMLTIYDRKSTDVESFKSEFSFELLFARDGSNDSCLTTSETTEEKKLWKSQIGCSSMDHGSIECSTDIDVSVAQHEGRKRSFSNISGESCIEQPIDSNKKLKDSVGITEEIDLNN